jgi:excisionase family DNA binding protein
MMLVACKQAAKHFGVHTNTIRKWYSAGKIAGVDMGNGRRRYDIESIRGIYSKELPCHEEESE